MHGADERGIVRCGGWFMVRRTSEIQCGRSCRDPRNPAERVRALVSDRVRRGVVYVLFLLAAVHCTRSIFADNVSLIDLPRYAVGLERNPFQSRVAMMDLLRWAHGNATLERVAAWFDSSLTRTPHFAVPPEHVTPEKLVCIGVGLLAVLGMVGMAIWVGHRQMPRAVWWLPGVLTLGMLYATYAARYEAQFWYPYDLMHFALFGAAALCLLEDRWWMALALFTLDVPVRETAVFLLPLVIGLGFIDGTLRRAMGFCAMMLAIWLPMRAMIFLRFRMNPSEVSVRGIGFARALLNPLHWPQIATAFGFLAVPLWLNRKLLPERQRVVLYAALPGLLVTTLFGIWYETRIYDEWILPASLMAATELVVYLGLADRETESEFILDASKVA